MIWFLLILLLFLGLVLWLPVVVEIDTRRAVYQASWRGILSVRMMPEAEQWRWYLRVFFWQMEMTGRADRPAKARQPAVQKRSAGKNKFPGSIRRARALFKQLLKAIRVDRLIIDWDTGDFVLNAWLYPVFRLASGGHRQLSINFFGEQAMAIHLHTRLGLLALAALRVFITSKK